MPYDDEDDLFSEDFDFVDEDEDEVVAEEESGDDQDDEGNASSKSKQKLGSRGGKRGKKPRGEANAEDTQAGKSAADSEEAAAKPEEPAGPPADHVVHVYEFGNFKRTINREFTSEDAAAFAAEYNRTSAAHARQAVAASRDEEPAPAL